MLPYINHLPFVTHSFDSLPRRANEVQASIRAGFCKRSILTELHLVSLGRFMPVSWSYKTITGMYGLAAMLLRHLDDAIAVEVLICAA